MTICFPWQHLEMTNKTSQVTLGVQRMKMACQTLVSLCQQLSIHLHAVQCILSHNRGWSKKVPHVWDWVSTVVRCIHVTTLKIAQLIWALKLNVKQDRGIDRRTTYRNNTTRATAVILHVVGKNAVCIYRTRSSFSKLQRQIVHLSRKSSSSDTASLDAGGWTTSQTYAGFRHPGEQTKKPRGFYSAKFSGSW